MAILHGNWLINSDNNSAFFVWGETWRSLSHSAQDIHPFVMSESDFLDFLLKHHLTLDYGSFSAENILLPNQFPISQIQSDSAVNLQSWRINGAVLNPLQTIKFLQTLPLTDEDFFGGDLKFWIQVYRWSLDLIARCKFLPNLIQKDSSIISRWQPLLDSSLDQARLAKFSHNIPLICLSYINPHPPTPTGTIGEGEYVISNNSASQGLILNFLSEIIDSNIRIWSQNQTIPKTDPLINNWFKRLSSKNNILEISPSVKRLQSVLNNWMTPIQDYLITDDSSQGKGITEKLFRTCFILKPPVENQADWKLEYVLQAIDQPDFIIDNQTIWQNPVNSLNYQNRRIESPQETFLKGLGLGAKIYPLILESLNESQPEYCSLNPIEAYQFIQGISWKLQDHGLGVIIPESLAQSRNDNKRLGLKISATTEEKTAGLGLQSLLKFQWELAIGDQTISVEKFKEIVDLQTPFVQVNGEWLALQPTDIKSAQEFLAKPQTIINLSLEDALRLSTGDTKTIEKLPIVSFETSGVLENFISNLTDNRKIELIDIPPTFKGELRPYQLQGVSWLNFLVKWGLGACLADDMGLGKCLANDTLIFVNGQIEKAEDIWDNYSTETVFDGEGFWTSPHQTLWVNSIDEQTNRIVVAKVKRLYRQKVNETLRKITLKDGSSITVTQRHKLLTNKGWNNNLNIGDYVCLPNQLIWKGTSEDHDLVKFLAWQIAEGNENLTQSRLIITQKDIEILIDLKSTIKRISEKYGFPINKPSISSRNDHRCPDLRLTSVEYRRFLEDRGYQWGKLSREKTIPEFIMQGDLNTIRIFLSNYFDAEGSVIMTMRSMEISSASSILIQQLAVLLRRFGIWLRISVKQKPATNGKGIWRDYYVGVMGGNSVRRFNEQIGFNTREKQIKLIEIWAKTSNTNVEGIPASEILAEMVNKTQLPLRHFGVHSNVYISGKQQFSHTSLAQVISSCERILTGVSEQEYRQLKPSKWSNQTLNNYEKLDREYLELAELSLKKLFEQEVFYCQISEIEDIEYSGWVYDLEVDKYHNFVANNIICHNTIQTITFLLHINQQENLTRPVLIICPTSVLGNWEKEIKKFAPNLKVLQYYGTNRPKNQEFIKAIKNQDIVITSYALITRDIVTLNQIEWTGIILDEAQNIKNYEAKQAQNIRKLKGDFRIALTGTPVENRLTELWSILDFLNPDYLGTKQFFQRRFALPIEKYGDKDSVKILRSLVQPFILRRLKTDTSIIQDLPEKQEMNIFCGLTTEQATIYQKLVEESLQDIDQSEGIQRHGMILSLLMKLKQICNHPAHFLKEKNFKSGNRSGKLQRLEEMLLELVGVGDRSLIFTQFAEFGKLLQPYLQEKLGEEILFLYGGTKKQQREEMTERFQNDPQGPKIFILSLKAGGTGLNLTRANHVFHYDRWWNPAVENQATDRVFRIGQKRNVQVHKFICTGTLEEKINDLIESKKSLAEQTINSGENWLTEMDTEQLRNLLLLDRGAILIDN